MMTDPIADLLTRIRNARLARHNQVAVPYSRFKEAVVQLLIKTGHVGSYEVKQRQLRLNRLDLISLKRLSKPGSRLYIGAGRLKPYLRGRGETIISTSQGLMTVKEANKKKLGGELICRIV